jgi:hypothetical protein
MGDGLVLETILPLRLFGRPMPLPFRRRSEPRLAEFIERFEVERQGLFSTHDVLFVGFTRRIPAFELT